MIKKNMFKSFLLVGIVLLLSFSNSVAQKPVLLTDSLSLLKIKTINPNSKISWNTSIPVEQWEGVYLTFDSYNAKYIVRYLSLDNMSIDSLPSDSMHFHFYSLEVLSLEGNRLKTLPENNFFYTNLDYINLSYNRLTSLPSTFNVKSGASILLKGNRFTSLPSSIFDTTIERWDLSDNELDTLVDAIFHRNLKSLNLSNNRLKSLPSAIGNCKYLETLNLYNNELTSLPSQIGNCSNLSSLDMASNLLTTLPSEIGNMLSLQNINLSNNNLSSIPNEINNLYKLHILKLDRNSLTTLPNGIGSLQSLHDLYLNNNYLESIPSSIGSSLYLNKLYLQNNNLTTLPIEIGNLYHLDELYVGDNQLTSIPTEISQLAKLSMLDLSRNKLTTLPPEIVAITPGKGGIVIDSNYISHASIDSSVITWLNANSPDWLSKQYQSTANIEVNNNSPEIKKAYSVNTDGKVFKLSRKPQKAISIKIFDLAGKTLYEQDGITNQFISDVSLPVGIFIWSIREGNMISNDKVSVQR